MKQQLITIITWPWRFLCWICRSIKLFWLGQWWKKLILIIIGILLLLLGISYGISRWYVASTRDRPLEIGVTYVADYATALGVDPHKTYVALLHDLKVKNLRLVSYWNKIEPNKGTYAFTELDWQFELAEKSGAKISLALGMRQPRWPECHIPEWALNLSPEKRQVQLLSYIERVVDRYKNSPALKSYQLENEALLSSFGECPEPNRQYLQQEFDLVKKLDSKTPIIMSRSNNAPALVLGQPSPDIVGMSVYRRVWNENIYKGYFNYPLPSWYYAALAGTQKIVTGKDSALHEMQMEPWGPSGKFITALTREEQDESMNANMFSERVDFAKNTGMRQIDLWGAEWWYYRKVVLNDDSLWQEAKKVF